MADKVQGGYVRNTTTDALGPLVVVGVAGAPLSAGLTDTQLRATAVPVSSTALTDTQLRATAVPVSGPQTDAQARASPQPAAASPETSSIYDGSIALTPKRALLNQAASGTNQTLVAAVASKKIRVLAAAFVCGGTATDLTFRSATAGAISCLFANAANGGATLAFNPVGWFETTAGEALSVTTGAGSTTGIQVTYVEV